MTFDWKKILATPIPSADAEKWRERRHAERASRAADKSGPDVMTSSSGEINDLENNATLENNQAPESKETSEPREPSEDDEGNDPNPF